MIIIQFPQIFDRVGKILIGRKFLILDRSIHWKTVDTFIFLTQMEIFSLNKKLLHLLQIKFETILVMFLITLTIISLSWQVVPLSNLDITKIIFFFFKYFIHLFKRFRINKEEGLEAPVLFSWNRLFNIYHAWFSLESSSYRIYKKHIKVPPSFLSQVKKACLEFNEERTERIH